jgi:hypothetical protein
MALTHLDISQRYLKISEMVSDMSLDVKAYSLGTQLAIS